MLEFAQVIQAVIGGEAAFPYPVLCFAQPALRQPQPRLHRCDRPDFRHGAVDVHALGRVQQLKRASLVTLGLSQPGLDDEATRGRLRQGGRPSGDTLARSLEVENDSHSSERSCFREPSGNAVRS